MPSQQPDAAQIRAALGLLCWENEQLARACAITPQSVSNIKRGVTRPQPRILAAIKRVLEFQGIEFLENSGVRFRPHNFEALEGADGFLKFYDIVYEHVREHGGDICVSGVDEGLFAKYRPKSDVHRIRMTELVKERKDINMRILVQEGDYNFIASAYAKYRWQQKEYFAPTSFYVFGNYLALISFAHDPAPLVMLIHSAPFADAYRHSFNLMWSSAQKPPTKAPK